MLWKLIFSEAQVEAKDGVVVVMVMVVVMLEVVVIVLVVMEWSCHNSGVWNQIFLSLNPALILSLSSWSLSGILFIKQW